MSKKVLQGFILMLVISFFNQACSSNNTNTMDTTITGSRNGLTPLFLWDFITSNGLEGFTVRANKCQELAQYTLNELKRIGIASNHEISVRAIGFIIIGHQKHHQRVFQERYLMSK